MIWLIGCKGMLGTEIALQLTENKIDFTGTDIDVDITNPQALAEFVKGKTISYIINCSAYTAVDKAENDAEFAKKLNEDGPRNIANLANRIHAKMIHISTDYVFDGSGKVPYTEDMQIAPIGVYGKTKAAGESAVKQNLHEYYIVRTAWLYSEFGKNFVKTMLNLTSTKSQLKVVFDQVGTPTYAYDLAKAISEIIDDYKQESSNYNQWASYTKNGIYHFSNEGVCSWYDFTKMIQQIAVELETPEIVGTFGTHAACEVLPCHSDEFPSPVRRPSYSVLDKTKIKETFGIKVIYWTNSLAQCCHNYSKSNKY